MQFPPAFFLFVQWVCIIPSFRTQPVILPTNNNQPQTHSHPFKHTHSKTCQPSQMKNHKTSLWQPTIIKMFANCHIKQPPRIRSDGHQREGIPRDKGGRSLNLHVCLTVCPTPSVCQPFTHFCSVQFPCLEVVSGRKRQKFSANRQFSVDFLWIVRGEDTRHPSKSGAKNGAGKSFIIASS